MALGDVRERGFTVIELLTVVALIALLATIAAPDFTSMIKGSKIKTAASDLHMALLKARSEAVKRNASVRVTPAGGDWGAGWTVTLVSDGTQLAVQSAPPGVSVADSPDTANITYQRSGRIQGNLVPTFTVNAQPPFMVASHKLRRCRTVTLGVGGVPTVRQIDCP